MSFIWVPTPNLPTPNLPTPVPPGEVSYEVYEVANTVDWGGQVRYNTANRSYDVVYEFPTLNVTVGVFENGFFTSANIGNAYINVATISQATINTANITNATITFAYATGNPTANMGMATKEYVDNAIAAISGGTGPDSTANLFLSTGDLLVGISPNTAQRLANGSPGQVLTVDANSSIKTSWKTLAGSQRATGVLIGTHHHPNKKLYQVLLKHADSIIMNDGEFVSGWDNLVADITTTGAGGLDGVSAEAANTWYEVYAIRNSTTGSKALLLHRMKNRVVDANWPSGAGGSQFGYLRRGDAAMTIPAMRYCTKVSQSFVPTRTQKLSSIDLKLAKIATPTGNLWITVQNDDGVGNADGTILATSEYLPVETLSSSTTTFRFVFPTNLTLTSGSRYHLVAEGDWPYQVTSTDANSIGFVGNTATVLQPGQQQWMANVGYTSGNLIIAQGYGDCRVWNVYTSTWKVAANAIGVGSGPSDLWFAINLEQNDTSLSLPSGYNQYALISYVCNDASSNFKEYHQFNRTISTGYEAAWKVYDDGTVSQGTIPLDVAPGLPPISTAARFLCTGLATSGFVQFGGRYSLDLAAGTSGTDVSARGAYSCSVGGNYSRPAYSTVVAVDDYNLLYAYSPGGAGVFMRIYVSSFTF